MNKLWELLDRNITEKLHLTDEASAILSVPTCCSGQVVQVEAQKIQFKM